MINQVVFVLMISSALFILFSQQLKHIVIAMTAFSIFASLCYLIYHAPDVAVAEAVIGSALSTILYIVALKKHRSFYIYFVSSNDDKIVNYTDLHPQMEDVTYRVMSYCAANDLNAQSVPTWENPEIIAKEHLYDLIIVNENNMVKIYGSDVDEHVIAIREMLADSPCGEIVSFDTLDNDE